MTGSASHAKSQQNGMTVSVLRKVPQITWFSPICKRCLKEGARTQTSVSPAIPTAGSALDPYWRTAVKIFTRAVYFSRKTYFVTAQAEASLGTHNIAFP
jgi:hypothetical protein